MRGGFSVTTKYKQRQGGLITTGTYLLVTVLETARLSSWCWHGQVLVRVLFWYFLLYPHMTESRKEHAGVPFMRVLSSMIPSS